MKNRIFVLGAADYEMAAIETLLTELGETVIHALDATGVRVHPGNTYRMAPVAESVVPWGGTIFLVECGDSTPGDKLVCREEYRDTDPCDVPSDAYVNVRSIDHHRDGDPGFGRKPEEYWEASSIGQVCIELARLRALPESWGHGGPDSPPGRVTRWHSSECVTICENGNNTHASMARIVPSKLLYTAAADHCLGAAYAGQCPGVDPDDLLRHRVEQQVAFRACPICGGTGGATGCGGDSGYEGPCHNGPVMTVESVLADIEVAHQALLEADTVTLFGVLDGPLAFDYDETVNASVINARDMRGRHVPGLPDAGTRYGISYIADGLPGPDGRTKIVCSGTKEVVDAFIKNWGPRNGLTDIYGDPKRGFAGGYI